MQTFYFAKLVFKTCCFLVFASLLLSLLYNRWETSLNNVKYNEEVNTAINNKFKGLELPSSTKEEKKKSNHEISRTQIITQAYWHKIHSFELGSREESGNNNAAQNLIYTNTSANLWRPNWSEENKNDRILEQLILSMDAAKTPNFNQGKVKTILLRDGFKWWSKKEWSDPQILPGCPGSFNKCLMTEKKPMHSVDAVIAVRDTFHSSVISAPDNVLIFFFILESPFASRAKLTNDNDLLASYYRGSDIVTPYAKWVYYNETVKKRKQEKDYSKGKSKSVAIFVSNCNTLNQRLEYVHALSKHIHVDVYGRCGSKNCARSNANDCFNMLKKDYYFYLSFENSNCRDYITEKFFDNGLKNDVVPIVLGAHPDDYKAVAPEGSYIHIEDFTSPQGLAEYLQYLIQNPDEYNKYFEWKGTGEFISTEFFCRVCAMAHYADFVAPPHRTTKYEWGASHGVTKDGMCLGRGKPLWKQ